MAKDHELATPMIAAVMGGHHNIVEILLPRLSYDDLHAEFIIASKKRLERVLGLILKATTDENQKALEEFVNAKGEDSNTPLHYAAESGHARVVQFLLLRRANLEAVNSSTMIPLAKAALSSSLDSIKLLLDAGASLETPIG
ncbi:uncharacterized protein Z519_08950 [Cladophialophora bantiana CBS 173.52]|uniref:Ankyrin repeat protein n=1 Tax=Cladophialophora bantiana (strain ATCC 10958 / CBS 173.52 / CDC B-1940 / NIH 8579) TaxID=1442370 RepID=A0A0D2EJW4_CLAB1|nr:uncharacterized protein Z519_08950 [Cladophialophora bantiana CBS 173.52]KIW90306.1 hypothetical protein Z519_08950 [Cladophialophora bantiana CBS 173.52]